MTEMVSEHDPQALQKAIDIILAGEIVAFPTDTVYGIGASAFNVNAIQKLFSVKGRDENKAIAILLADAGQLPQVCVNIPNYAERLASAFWPGALTLVLPRHPSVPDILSPLPTIGVRIPDHPFAQVLIRSCGPLAVTSANISGQPSATNAAEVLQQLDGLLPLVIDGGEARVGIASTVVDCTGLTFKILRPGAIDEKMLQYALVEG